MAKRGFEHFKINNILIIPIVAQFTVQYYPCLLVKIMPPKACTNAKSKLSFSPGLLFFVIDSLIQIVVFESENWALSYATDS